MTQVAVHDEHPAHRHLRMLGADLVFQMPGRRRDGPQARARRWPCNADAERLLARGELVGVWPEGFKGVGKPFSERYKLQRFGRGGFVSAALRTGVPIIPCSIVGAEEIYPMIGNMQDAGPAARPALLPGHADLPAARPARAGAAAEQVAHRVRRADRAPTTSAPGAADDPMLVFDLTDQVRETIQQTLYTLLMQRRSVFF